MYIISDNDLKESVYSALSSQTREFRQRLSFGEGIGSSFNKQISFDAGIKKIEISQVGNADNNGLVLGNCCSSSATVEFYNPKNTYRYNDKTMFVECGIKLDDGEYFYIPCGYYKVEKPETDDDWKTVKMTAYDVVDEMSGKWNTALTMPTTSYLLIKEIADKYNLELEIDPIILLGLQKRQITESEASMLTAYKEREVVGFLVGCLGGNARVNTVGKLYVGIYNPFPQEIINIETNVQWQNGFKKTLETEFEISSITSGVGDDVFTAGTGKGLTFVNPLITEEEIAEIYENYSGFTFQPSACEWRGNPCVECGDVVFVFDKSGNYYTVFVARQDIDLTGGLSMTTHCPSGDSDVSFDTLDDEIRQALNKQYTDLQQAIVDATSKINGALGGYYEVLDSDNDGNPDGWLIKEHEDGTGGIIRANKAGIALSKDGGKNYRTAITYDGINADLITSGKVKAEFIEADKLVVSKGNVTGLDTELADLLKAAEDAESKANTAQNTANNANSTASSALSTANTANSTANTASTNASNALSVANSANGKIAGWASANNTTLIDGAKIYTGSITAKQIESGSITADKLAIGLNNTNYAATEDWEGDTDYLSFSFDSNNSYKPKISMTFSATSFEKRLKLNKSFYVTAGSKLYCSAIAYADGTSNASQTYVGFGLYYSSSLNGDYSLSQYASSHNLSLKTEHKIGFDTTVNQSGYYRIEVWFNKCNNKAYLKDIFVAQGIPGEIVVNGKISSVNGQSYFDLNKNLLHTDNAEIVGGSIKIGGDDYYTKISEGSLTQHLTSSSVVGGLVPVGASGNQYQGLYFDGTNSKGIHLGYQASSGTFNYLFELTKDKVYASVPIESSDTAFSGLAYTRKYEHNGENSEATVKAGVGIYDSPYDTLSMKTVMSPYLVKKTYDGNTYYATAIGTMDYQPLTKKIPTNGAISVTLSFNYNSYGWAYFHLSYQKEEDRNTNVRRVVYEKFITSKGGDKSYTQTLNIPAEAINIMIEVTPDTAYSEYWVGLRDLTVTRNYATQFSASLELSQKNGDASKIISRIDAIESSGEAIGAIRMTTTHGTTPLLELGSDCMWYCGVEILSSLADLESRVSALEDQ